MTTGEMAVSRSERRRAPRYQCRVVLEIEWGSARLKARTYDISASGMFIEAEDVLWVGAGFRARLAAENPLWLECFVARVETGRGMGVTVALRGEQDHLHYHALLAKVAAAQ